MTSSERFKIIMDIIYKNDLVNCSRNHSMFEELKDDEFSNSVKVNEMVEKIRKYENHTAKYPEYIMYALRQRKGLDKYDTSKDDNFNKYPSNEVLSEVCIWEGLLGGYDSTIKNWINDIYGIDLDLL